jgi:hypothetical protein
MAAMDRSFVKMCVVHCSISLSPSETLKDSAWAPDVLALARRQLTVLAVTAGSANGTAGFLPPNGPKIHDPS